MRNLLIICGTFPPQADVGGLRPAMFAKYLPTFGWQSFILTGEYPEDDPRRDLSQHIGGLPPEERIHREFHGYRQEAQALSERGIMGRLKALFLPELAQPPGKAQAIERILPNLWPGVHFDAVLATVPDLDTLRLGRAFHQLRGTPWVADFRDLAEQEEGLATGFRQRLLHFRSKIRRDHLAKTASLITVVSRAHQQILERRLRRRIDVVYNGYDPEQPFSHPWQHRAEKFRIVYVGRLLSLWYRDPSVLFAGLDQLCKSQNSVADTLEVLFYGSEAEILEPLLRPFACRKCVKILPRVPHIKVPEILSQATVLLVLTNRGRQGILTTKFFEYLPTRKPVLCIPGDGGELDSLLQSTGIGLSCAEPSAVAAFLGKCHATWKNKRSLEPVGNKILIESFSRRTQTGILADLLNRVVVHGASSPATQDPKHDVRIASRRPM